MFATCFVGLILLLNIATFIVYGVDKHKARRAKWRISEATLLTLAAAGGSIGALLGMKVWRHKTKHKKFYIGVPLFLVLQIALTVYLTLISHN